MLPGVRNLLINRDSFALAHDMPGKYVGAKAHANLADALLSPDMLSHPTWPWFVAYARKSHAAGKRLFITTENLSVVPSVPNLRRLLSTLSAGIGYRVRVVVIHRRLFDKLPSVHSELYMAEYRPILAVREYLPIVVRAQAAPTGRRSSAAPALLLHAAPAQPFAARGRRRRLRVGLDRSTRCAREQPVLPDRSAAKPVRGAWCGGGVRDEHSPTAGGRVAHG